MDFRIVAVRGGRLFGPRELSCCDSQVINRDTVHVAIGTAPGTRTGCQAPLKREFLKKKSHFALFLLFSVFFWCQAQPDDYNNTGDVTRNMIAQFIRLPDRPIAGSSVCLANGISGFRVALIVNLSACAVEMFQTLRSPESVRRRLRLQFVA